MRTFWRKYAELSRRTRVLFWVVICSAALGLTLVVVNRALDDRPLDGVGDALNVVMFAALILFFISQRLDLRRRG